MQVERQIDWQSYCLALLSEMNSTQKWISATTQLYDVVLEALGEEWSVKAVKHAVLTEQWRPAPAQLRQIAAQLASPVPNEGDCFAEFWQAVQYSQPRPEWSHAIIGEVVRRLGGWKYFRDLRPHLIDRGDPRAQWFSRFMDAWKVCATEWTEEVSQQLAISPEVRDPKYRIGSAPTRNALPAGKHHLTLEASR